MKTLRTPDERFVGLPDFAFEPRYVEVGTPDDPDGVAIRVAFLDEGPSDAAPVLLMHGEPSWSFLYRHMIPVLVERGHRVIAPDLVGFGRSDKPTEQSDHTYARQVEWMRQVVVEHLDLSDATFFGQDWGGLVGLRVVASAPERFARLVVGNTGLPEGTGRISEAFLAWQKFSQETEDFPVGAIISGGCANRLPPEVVAAYDAPFPDDAYKAGARIFPTLVPTTPEDPGGVANQAAWKVLEAFDRPVLCAFSDGDPITRGGDRPFRERIPGAAGQTHVTIEGGGHFLQEDKGPELATVIADFVEATT
ncbi:MAG: haloalkane dehalogenase [Actinobacteria bacterium]|nr:haloalkane dehalogenase [Actinomycetota bacterium]